MTHSSRNPLLSVKWPTSPKNSVHAQTTARMTENQLKLNDAIPTTLLYEGGGGGGGGGGEPLFPLSSSLKPSTVSLPDSITLGSHNIPFSDSARNLGFILDSKLSMKKHVIQICQTAYFELKRISSIRRFLTEDATKTLVTSYILSRLDYCNCLLSHGYTALILSSNLSRKFRTLLQDLFSWHPVTTTPGKTALASHFRTY